MALSTLKLTIVHTNVHVLIVPGLCSTNQISQKVKHHIDDIDSNWRAHLFGQVHVVTSSKILNMILVFLEGK
jgi:hypothetical protein